MPFWQEEAKKKQLEIETGLRTSQLSFIKVRFVKQPPYDG